MSLMESFFRKKPDDTRQLFDDGTEAMRREVALMYGLLHRLKGPSAGSAEEFELYWWCDERRQVAQEPLVGDLEEAALNGRDHLVRDLSTADRWFWQKAERFQFGGYRMERLDPPVQTDIEPFARWRAFASVPTTSPAYGVIPDAKGKETHIGSFRSEGHTSAAALCGVVLVAEISSRVHDLALRRTLR